MKNKVIKIRISDQEEQVLDKQKNKSEYIRKLILGKSISKVSNYTLILELSTFWQKMQDKNIDKKLLDELKEIILSIQDDN